MNTQTLPLRAIYQPALRTVDSVNNPKENHLMIILHGRGDSPEGYETFREELNIPHLEFLLLQAPDPWYGGYSWYDQDPNQLPGIERSRKILEEVFQNITQQGWPMQRCFLFGFSQGCLMTLEFGGRFPEQLAGYLGISGFCYDPERLLKEASPVAKAGDWLVTHGTADDVLPVERTRKQMKLLQEGGFHLEYREYHKMHTIDPVNELPFLQNWIQSRMA